MAKSDEEIRKRDRAYKDKSRAKLAEERGPEVRGIYAKEEHKKTVQRAAQEHSKRLREGE